MADELISINEAAERGIERLRKPVWADPCAHLKIDIVDGRAGPWTHLFDPFNKECNGRDPVNVLCIAGVNYSEKEWLVHTGPTADSEEYKARVKEFEGCLSRGR